MAESISEGTLKSWVKNKGDFVQQDEEVATIETDKIDVSVNAPMSGTIVETMTSEEDTVTVGQDLFKIEPGEAPADGGAAAKEEPAEDEGKDEPAKEESKPAPSESESKPKEQSKEEKKPAKEEKAPSPPPKKESKPEPPKEEQQPSTGDRTESRVRAVYLYYSVALHRHRRAGQDVAYAHAHRRAIEAGAEHGRFAHHLQRD